MTKISLALGLASLGFCLSMISCSTTPSPAPPPVHDHSSHSHGTSQTSATKMKSPAPSTTSSAQVKPYPLNTCIVSDEALESMGGSISKVYNGQQVKFCCKGCVKEFDASPEEFLAKLN